MREGISDLAVIVAVVCVSLAVVSLMLVARLRASGASASRTSLLVGEVWLTVGVVMALLMAMGNLLGAPGGPDTRLGTDLRDIGRRFAVLAPRSKALFAAGGVLAAALFAHLLYSIGRGMRAAPSS